jgi:hypothetical protein
MKRNMFGFVPIPRNARLTQKERDYPKNTVVPETEREIRQTGYAQIMISQGVVGMAIRMMIKKYGDDVDCSPLNNRSTREQALIATFLKAQD